MRKAVMWIVGLIAAVFLIWGAFWVIDEGFDLDQGHFEGERLLAQRDREIREIEEYQENLRRKQGEYTPTPEPVDGCANVVRYASRTRPYIDRIVAATLDVHGRFAQLEASPELVHNHIWRDEIAEGAQELSKSAIAMRNLDVPPGAEGLGAALNNAAAATLSMAQLLGNFSRLGDQGQLVGADTDAINIAASLEDAQVEIEFISLTCG